MISITEAETLIKTLNVEYCSEVLQRGGFKFTLMLNKETKALFMITVAEFSDAPDCDCVFSYFVDRELQLSNVGVFINVVDGLKEFLSQGIA